MILFFFIFTFAHSLVSTKEGQNNIEYEIPSNDESSIIFRGQGILTAKIAKNAQHKKKIIIEEGITEIERKAFYQSYLKLEDEEFEYEEVELPRSLVKIGDLSFKTQQGKLRRVHFPDYPSTQNIKTKAKNQNRKQKQKQKQQEEEEKLEKFYSLREIGDYAFNGQPLTDHNIPGTFTSVGKNAFEFSSLDHITFSSKISHITRYSFHRCESLRELELPPSVTRLSTSCFDGCVSLSRVNWPASRFDEFGYNSFCGCTSLQQFTFPSAGSGISRVSYAFENCLSLAKCVFPRTIDDGELGRGTLMNCANLREVVLPTNVARLPEDFMRNSSIEFAYLPSCVRTLGYNAFRDCRLLKYVHVQHTEGFVTFEANVFVGANGIEIAVVEGNVTRIEERLLRMKTLCYGGTVNPEAGEESIDANVTSIFVTEGFVDANEGRKFGGSGAFEGYAYEVRGGSTCDLPEIYTPAGGESTAFSAGVEEPAGEGSGKKGLSKFAIAMIAAGAFAVAAVIVAVVAVAVSKKKKKDAQSVYNQGLIDEDL